MDASSWLHKGAFACAYELGMGIPTDLHIKFCMSRVSMMLAHGVRQPRMRERRTCRRGTRGRVRTAHVLCAAASFAACAYEPHGRRSSRCWFLMDTRCP